MISNTLTKPCLVCAFNFIVYFIHSFFLQGLSNPLGNNKIAEIILKTLIDCPDLVKPTLLKLEPFFQPRNSKNWFDIIEFSENVSLYYNY